MTKEEREVQRKLKVLRHAEKTGPCGQNLPILRRWTFKLLPLEKPLTSSAARPG